MGHGSLHAQPHEGAAAADAALDRDTPESTAGNVDVINPGSLLLPATHVVALYVPEMRGALPDGAGAVTPAR